MISEDAESDETCSLIGVGGDLEALEDEFDGLLRSFSFSPYVSNN